MAAYIRYVYVYMCALLTIWLCKQAVLNTSTCYLLFTEMIEKILLTVNDTTFGECMQLVHVYSQ